MAEMFSNIGCILIWLRNISLCILFELFKNLSLHADTVVVIARR